MSEFIERRRINPRMTISQILEHMQHQADDLYSGDLQGNIIQIFGKLSPDNRKTFLRKSLLLHWEDQINRAREGRIDVIVDDITIDHGSVENERNLIANDNYVEQRKFKLFLTKFLFTSLAISFIAMIVLTVIMAPEDDGPKMLMENLGHLFSLLNVFL